VARTSGKGSCTSRSAMPSEFETYRDELLLWNKKFNLTSITDPKEIEVKHFKDSLSVLEALDLDKQSVIDIGCGAGFPGIPLKLSRPQIKLTLVDSVKKKTDFLEHLIKKLGLKEVRVILSRAEDLSDKHKEAYDVAVARAVKELRVLCEYCLPFVKVGGVFIAMKADQAEDEIGAAKNSIEILGAKIKQVKKVRVDDMMRTLVVIEKIKETPRKYPRHAGIPAKRPL